MKSRPAYTNNIAELCRKKGWADNEKESRAALALHLSNAGYPVSEHTVKAWWYQERQPSAKALEALCNIFSVMSSDVLTFKD